MRKALPLCLLMIAACSSVESTRYADVTPNCVKIGVIANDNGGKLKKSILGHLGVLEDASCSIVLSGKIVDRDTVWLGVVSRVSVGAQLRLADGDKVIWEGQHTATAWDGGVPLDPVSALTGMVAASVNVRDEQDDRLVDDLARRLVATMPTIRMTPVMAKPTGTGDGWVRVALERHMAGDADGAVDALRLAGKAYVDAGDQAAAQRVLKTLNAMEDQP